MENLIQKLVLGSAEINRMRKETGVIVGMLVGQLDPQTFERQQLKTESVEWLVRKDNGKVKVDCVVKVGGQLGMGYANYGDGTYRAETVQPTYESLPEFVENMLTAYPYLREKLEPFLHAAECC